MKRSHSDDDVLPPEQQVQQQRSNSDDNSHGECGTFYKTLTSDEIIGAGSHVLEIDAVMVVQAVGWLKAAHGVQRSKPLQEDPRLVSSAGG